MVQAVVSTHHPAANTPRTGHFGRLFGGVRLLLAWGRADLCNVPPITPSTYHARVVRRQDPFRLSERAKQDCDLKPDIARASAENFAIQRARKVWRRKMRETGLAGVIDGKPVRTTIGDTAAPCPLDHSIASSRRRRQTCCGCPTSLMSLPRWAWSVSPAIQIIDVRSYPRPSHTRASNMVRAYFTAVG